MTDDDEVLSIKLTDIVPPQGMTLTISFSDGDGDTCVTDPLYVPRPPESIADAISRVEEEVIAQTGKEPCFRRRPCKSTHELYILEEANLAGPIPHIQVRLNRPR